MKDTENKFNRLNSTIKIFKWFLLGLISIVVYIELAKQPFCPNPLTSSCLDNFFSSISTLTKNSIPLLAALLATLVADRHLIHNSIMLENERIFEVVQVTHRYIAITQDLESKIAFLKSSMTRGGFTLAGYIVVCDSIESRYESYFEKDIYKHLPGDAVNIINSMSGSIMGLISAIAGLKTNNINLSDVLPPSSSPPPVEDLLREIKDLKDKLYELRTSIDKS